MHVSSCSQEETRHFARVPTYVVVQDILALIRLRLGTRNPFGVAFNLRDPSPRVAAGASILGCVAWAVSPNAFGVADPGGFLTESPER